MLLDEIPLVDVDFTVGYKFIVVRITDNKGDVKEVIRVRNANYEYHNDILQDMRYELKPHGMTAKCIGGGRIEISPNKKAIKIWDSSGDFGYEPDRSLTEKMLQSAYPDYQITSKR